MGHPVHLPLPKSLYLDQTGSQTALEAGSQKPEASSQTGLEAGRRKLYSILYTVQYAVQYIIQCKLQYTVQYTVQYAVHYSTLDLNPWGDKSRINNNIGRILSGGLGNQNAARTIAHSPPGVKETLN